jgi:hypothetical protein
MPRTEGNVREERKGYADAEPIPKKKGVFKVRRR